MALVDEGLAARDALERLARIADRPFDAGAQVLADPGELDGLMDEGAYREWVKTL